MHAQNRNLLRGEGIRKKKYIFGWGAPQTGCGGAWAGLQFLVRKLPLFVFALIRSKRCKNTFKLLI